MSGRHGRGVTDPIRRLEIVPEGVIAHLESGARRRLSFGVIEAADVKNVHVAEGRESFIMLLRSGDKIEWSVDQMTEV